MAVAYGQPISQIYNHTSTSNRSFIDTCNFLHDIGIKNWKFPLALIDKDLAYIDPYDKRLNQVMKTKIFKECLSNPWYFFREVVRVPDSGIATGVKFNLHRGNLAMIFLLSMNVNINVELPRQVGKTIGALCWYLYVFNFRAANSEFSFLNKKFEDSKDNLKRIKDIRDLLPDYLKFDSIFSQDGTKLKGRNSVEYLTHPINHNRIRTVAGATSRTNAASLMRGRTTNIIYMDEFAFMKFNNIIYLNMVPAFNTAANNSKRNNNPYGMMITTTPGDLTTDEGRYAFEFKNKATRFSELWYDLNYFEITNILNSNTNSAFVYVRYTYQQLGYSEQWFKDLCLYMQKDWASIRREVLLEWAETSENSPFRKEDLDTIRGLLKTPIRTLLLLNKYTFNIYKDINITRHPPLIGVDVSGGYQKDSSAITVVDSYSTEVAADMNSNFISTLELADVIYEIVSKWMPNAVVNIERNGGFGASVLAKLIHTSIKHNLFFSIKDRVIEERSMGTTIQRKTQKTKVYGSDSTKHERELLMEILRDRIDYHKDKIISPIIYEELKTLEVKKDGRIEHSVNGHDDQIFSWLWALYIYYYGSDLMSQWGITKKTLKTDADLDEAVYGFQEGTEYIGEYIDTINQNNEIKEQLDMMASAPGQKLYQEWVQEEMQKDQEAMNAILATKIGKAAYNRQFHVDTSMEDANTNAFYKIPDSVFNMNYDENEYHTDKGNLYNQMMSNKER